MLRRPSRACRLMHHMTLWCLVAFYGLACMRAFIPGLCASIGEAEVAAASAVLMSQAHSCCRVPGPATPEAPTSSPAADSGCAFCHLVQSIADPPATVDVVLLSMAFGPAEPVASGKPELSHARVLPPLRAPPA